MKVLKNKWNSSSDIKQIVIILTIVLIILFIYGIGIIYLGFTYKKNYDFMNRLLVKNKLLSRKQKLLPCQQPILVNCCSGYTISHYRSV